MDPPRTAQQYLEKVDISKGVAEAEHVFLLGMFWDRLHNAVLSKEGTSWGTALVHGILPIGLIKQQGTAWKRQKQDNKCPHCPTGVRKGKGMEKEAT